MDPYSHPDPTALGLFTDRVNEWALCEPSGQREHLRGWSNEIRGLGEIYDLRSDGAVRKRGYKSEEEHLTLAPLAAARRITSVHIEIFLAMEGVLHIWATAASISTKQWFKWRLLSLCGHHRSLGEPRVNATRGQPVQAGKAGKACL